MVRLRLEDDDDENIDNFKSVRNRPPRPSTKGIRQSLALMQTASRSRARRRSSARFLRLSRTPEEDEEDEEDDDENTSRNLQELYKKAIRMNAENKINATNSWSLCLIENIDNFLEDDNDAQEEENASTENQKQPTSDQTTLKTDSAELDARRVNFTKASCTLDASVKIYSYRVDDVYLTSYKVLANLHRNSNNKKKANSDDRYGDDEQTANNVGEAGDTESCSKRASASTLETNRGKFMVACSDSYSRLRNEANINLNKLDAAYDIDPLFSKMSKTFDEGGAKGLLLANLGVSNNGCNIVFDSTEDNDEKQGSQEQHFKAALDISLLNSKLQELLRDEDDICRVPLVPQLSNLRSDHHELQEEGFVASTPRKSRSRRTSFYGVTEEEEKEADRSIHLEALERSRASLGRSFISTKDSDEEEKGEETGPLFVEEGDDDDASGFGNMLSGGFDDGGDDDDMQPFLDRLSSISGAHSFDQSQRKHTSALLDALSSSQAMWTDVNATSFWKENKGNQWAGSTHWKRGRVVKPVSEVAKQVSKTPRKSRKKRAVVVDLSSSRKDLNENLFGTKSKRKKATTWSKATISRHSNNENILPLDAGIGVDQLFSLFSRRNTTILQQQRPNNNVCSANKKTVGFADFDDGVDDDNDDGLGYMMTDDPVQDMDDDVMVGQLEGVRKVEKVRVGHATIAKKVDVKRLKRDLWQELEEKFETEKVEESDSTDDSNESSDLVDEQSVELEDGPGDAKSGISFQQAVGDMEQAKSQPDVTLSFYFICILHLANEKGLRLESKGLEDFRICNDGISSSSSL